MKQDRKNNLKKMKKNNLVICLFVLGIISLFLDLIFFIVSNYSGKFIFTPWFAFFDYLSFISFFFTWLFATSGIILGIIGLQSERHKLAKKGIILSTLGILIYFYLVYSLYGRFGMLP